MDQIAGVVEDLTATYLDGFGVRLKQRQVLGLQSSQK
jgi:hypothetical protein